eukprot:Ihof_evm3s17 gene=Ihof_evmTU3s17
MGVQGLWFLLEPVGRPLKLEDLSNKVVAVDISGWLWQYIKALRDEEGTLVRNAHLLGLFKRLSILLYHNIKPVIVFDGAAPTLKKNVLASRRKLRDRSDETVQKTAQRLFQNQMRSMALATFTGKEGDPLMLFKKGNDEDDMFALPPPEPGQESKRNLQDLDYIAQDDQYEVEKNVGEVEIEEDMRDLHHKYFGAKPGEIDYTKVMDGTGFYRLISTRMTSNPFQQKYNTIEMQMVRLMNKSSISKRLDEIREQLQYTMGEFESQRIASEENREYILQYLKDEDVGSLKIALQHTTTRGERIKMGEDTARLLRQQERDKEERDGESIEEEETVDEVQGTNYKAEQENEELEKAKKEIEALKQQIIGLQKGIANKKSVISPPGTMAPNSSNTIGGGVTISIDGLDTVDADDLFPASMFEPIVIPPNTEHTIESTNKDLVSMSEEEQLALAIALSLSSQTTAKPSQPHIHPDSGMGGFPSITKEQGINEPGPVESIQSLSSNPTASVPSLLVGPDTDIPSPFRRNPVLKAPGISQVAPKAPTSHRLSGYEATAITIGSSMETHSLPLVPTTSTTTMSSSTSSLHSHDSTVRMGKQITQLIGHEEALPDTISSSPMGNDAIKGLSPTPFIVDDLTTIKKGREENRMDDNSDNNQIETVNDKKENNDWGAGWFVPSVIAKDISEIKKENELDNQFKDKKYFLNEVDGLDNDINNDKMPDDEIIVQPVGTQKVLVSPMYNGDKKEEPIENPVIKENKRISKEILNDFDDVEGSDSEDGADDGVGATLTKEDMIALQQTLFNERVDLQSQQRFHKRDAEGISSDMYADSKELLQLFGIPWVDSPAEAEAQCAQLERQGLIHATITEDSDTFLFGAKTVIKHAFSRGHAPEVYRMSDIKSNLHLSRRELVDISMLSGSDYTDGIYGVGPVTSVEILCDFGPEETNQDSDDESQYSSSSRDPLILFRDWLEAVFLYKTLPSIDESSFRRKL